MPRLDVMCSRQEPCGTCRPRAAPEAAGTMRWPHSWRRRPRRTRRAAPVPVELVLLHWPASPPRPSRHTLPRGNKRRRKSRGTSKNCHHRTKSKHAPGPSTNRAPERAGLRTRLNCMKFESAHVLAPMNTTVRGVRVCQPIGLFFLPLGEVPQQERSELWNVPHRMFRSSFQNKNQSRYRISGCPSFLTKVGHRTQRKARARTRKEKRPSPAFRVACSQFFFQRAHEYEGSKGATKLHSGAPLIKSLSSKQITVMLSRREGRANVLCVFHVLKRSA
jgi:hypothetical protein